METELLNQPGTSSDSDDVVVSVRGVSKQYQLFNDPQDRLKHMLFWRFGKTYGRPFWALQDISFDVRRGEWFGIIGMNGSGKSTLLQIISGILQPTSGDVKIKGRIAALLELGSGFNPEYTGRENININAAILGLSAEEIKTRMDEIIAFADIGEFIDQPVKIYSSGMFVRLAFAVSTCVDADILIIDEALSVGDIFFTQKCFRRLEELRQKGVSIILVTHAMGIVEQYCKDSILLHHGQSHFLGLSVEAVKHYYMLVQGNIETINKPSTSSPKVIQVNSKRETPEDSSFFWPGSEAFIDLSGVKQITNNWAHCTGIALCDQYGKPCHVFHQGQMASFFHEFEFTQDVEVPIGGVRIDNDKGIIVYSKGSIFFETPTPQSVNKGCRMRFRQDIKLDIAPGEYTFTVLLSSINSHDYLNRSKHPYSELAPKILRLNNVVNAGVFIVNLPYLDGPMQLLHHGVANLPGDCMMKMIEPVITH